MLAIADCTLFTPSTVIDDGVVLVDGRLITAVGRRADVLIPRDARLLSGRGLILAPGFVDLQVNGAFGHDFTLDPATIWEASRYLPRFGVTAFAPTLVSCPPPTIAQAQEVLGRRSTSELWRGAWPVGLHLEGPFLNPEQRGAHDPAYLQLPTMQLAEEWRPARGVRMVTLAPELPGALRVAEYLAQRGVRVGAGHSSASYEDARAGFDAGIRYVTHLFNSMTPLHHRSPGLAAAAMEDERVTMGLIADGRHVHPAFIRIAWRSAPGRLNLVSDATAALGAGPGTYHLGESEIKAADERVRLADGTLAGTMLSLDRAVRNLVRLADATIQQALTAATTIPAALVGLDGRKGRIAPGYDADMVLLSPDLRVQMTIVLGEVVYQTLESEPA
jgi:N-acetylglucosamine-6-phosphate deacetylase